jgi:hypothetical protein
MAPLPTGTSHWDVAARLSLGVGAIETLLAGHRRRRSLSPRELANVHREPTETAAPWAGGLLLVERPRGQHSQERS